MKKVYFLLILISLGFTGFSQTTSFSFTGSVQTYTVPAGVTQIAIDLTGGKGGKGCYANCAGGGGRVQCTLNVTPAQVYSVYVGNQGSLSGNNANGGVGSNGFTGHLGGNGTTGATYWGGGGGAASEIWLGGGVVVVAGAGGGGSGQCTSDLGGAGGGPNGTNGEQCASYNSTTCGAGGTTSAGGVAGTCGGAVAGTQFVGGNAGAGSDNWSSGGGGGYFGGGGGCSQGAGGGGSSYPATAGGNITAIAHSQGFNTSGAGYVVITTLCSSSIAGGTTAVCAGATTTLTGTPLGGTWSSVTTGVATVGSTGIVTGVAAGTSVISYTPGCGSSGASAVTVTVLAAPAAISGNAPINVCSSETLTDATGAGTWSSSNTGVATIGSSSGLLTGVTGGNPNITFTLTSSGCTTVAVATINAIPAITGSTSTLCTGTTTTLSDAMAGGTWSSSNTAVGSVSASGVVSAISAGTINISYTITGGCNVIYPMTINTQPAAITGAGSLCGGNVPTSISLGEVTGGGTWSSSNTAVGTVSATGVVTGISAGIATISYVMPGGCFSTAAVTVNAVAAISGLPTVCIGTTITMTDATGGGNWSSSNAGVASVGVSSGVVTGVSLGTATISYTVSSTGCSAVTSVNVVSPPSTYAVTGGGGYCAGGTGLHIGLNSSDNLVIYTLFNGATAVATHTGTGGAIDFGVFTAAGTYTAVANFGNPCFANQSGSAIITVNPLPTAYTVGGGGSYCSGGTGVNVTLSSSTIGVNYQLMLGATPIGSPAAGTSGLLSLGPVTTAGTYTIIATNATTGCTNTMAGSAVVSINALPTAFSVTGGGGYCLGGTGVHIGTSGSTTGVSYQLLLSGSPVGSPLSGTGTALDFGLITTGGSYTVLATNTSTGCQLSMSGTVTITVNPLPTVFTVTGGGAYCFGGSGIAVSLNGSTAGINYQLYNGSSTVGSPVAGTGASISFGLQTLTGSYTVVATNVITGCVNNMFGSVLVSTNPLPTVFTVTGGGGYCAGGTGVHIGVSGSTVGTTYSLYSGATLVSAASGTGLPVDFGPILSAGTYTVTAVNIATGCSGNMSGSVTVTINPLPTVFTVTGGGTYCAGGLGLPIGLSNSALGVNYQLYNGTTAIGAPVAGTGGAITFGNQTLAGSYTVIATNGTTTCTNNMSGSAVITINPLPTVYAMTGGGGYCAGGTGVHVGLAASNTGINYQLYNGSTAGATLTGSGFALDYGALTTAGTYTVTATNPATGCGTGMSGAAIITINALPTAYAVTGGGAYCAGGTGMNIGLGNSTGGVNYQLMNGITPMGSPVAGSGSAISFGPQTTAGTYTVVATTGGTGCNNNMTGSAVITINPLPAVFTVTGGGSYCAGGAGQHVGLSSSVAGINYQLYVGGAIAGLPMAGTGTSLDFGLQTTAGTYTITGTNNITGCASNMTGSVTITINPLPGLNTITGGGSYCAGGTGVHVGLNGSIIGNTYQLYNSGTPTGSPMAGTSLPLDFGPQTAAGTYTVIASNISTGCQSTMTGSTTITINALPAPQTVTGGGSYCTGGTGVNIGLAGSVSGVNYQLYNGTTAVGPAQPGNTGFPVNFGLKTAAGIYTVIGTNTTTGCSGNMTGSATVGTYPLPVVYNVTGGGNYCAGGAGVNIGLSGSNTGVSYQLLDGGLPVSALPGSGVALNFGLQTLAGTYTIVATNTTTGCPNTMNSSAVVAISPLPGLHTVTGGGAYCAGGTGVAVGLDGSDAGITYQLWNGSPVGSPVAGTGSPINFGMETGAGTYTVMAINTGTTCTNTMTGSAVITINPLPTGYTVTVSGGGQYCSGGTGADIQLLNSDPGNTYQLYNGVTAVGSPVSGPGLLDFGLQTAAGTYTVVGTNTGTGCSGNMSNSVTITINALPTTYAVIGGGAYCAGGAGVHVMLANSNTGITYQLLIGGAPTGTPMAGTGMGLDFGPQTVGGNYTIKATNNATGCVNTMSGSVNVVANPLPTVYGVSSTSSTYCAGGGGVDIWLNSSDAGISYQLYNGSTTSGSPLAGIGSSIDFGYHFTAGTYRVIAVNNTTGCSDTMSSSVTIVVDPLPTSYAITGGGSYCNGGTGVHVGLGGSTAGISYQLLLGGVNTGSPVTGTGGPIDFGLQTTAGNYTVVATNPATTCVSTMSGTATIAINALPAVYTLGGGGNYCAGGTGADVTLSSSTLGVDYQLSAGGTAVGGPVAGSGTTLDFGSQTIAGTYTVVATNTMTGCTNNMVGLVTIGINPAPIAWSVVGGGNYCPGGTGVHVGISNTTTGISYQLYNGGTATGSPLAGSGGGEDFGLQTAAGTYTVKATNTATGCTNTMSGSATVVINTLPAVYTVMGGGNYCAGGSGVHVGLSNSDLGVNYKLINGITTVTTLPGTGSPLDFGFQTAAGTYTVQAVNATTGCMDMMSGSAAIIVNAPVTPFVSISSNHGDTICAGTFTTFTANTLNGGGLPTYQWTVNGAASAVGPMYSYTPSNGDVIGVTLTSSAQCATPSSVNNSVTMAVDPQETPEVNVTANPGTVICQGTSVTFTADPLFGGSAPAYTWFINGAATSSAPSYTYMPANGDVVFVVMTGSYRCALSSTATSSHMSVEVDIPTLPVVTITAHPGNTIAPGTTVTLIAGVVNGGPSPSYQWLVNGVPVPGATQPTYVSNSFNDGDSATCQVLSSGGCAGLLGFNSIYLHIRGVSVQQVSSAGADMKVLPNPNKGVFTLKGTLGSGYDQDVTIEVTDMLGQAVYTSKVTAHNGELNEHIDMGTVANGMYLLNVRSATGNNVFHLVVEQ